VADGTVVDVDELSVDVESSFLSLHAPRINNSKKEKISF
jgi:hypothetical protein